MINPKKHAWVLVDKDIGGIYKCRNCQMTKIKSKGIKTVYARQGIIDHTNTKQNCFNLSK